MKKIAIVVYCCLLSLVSVAQNATVYGKVMDKTTGEPIIGATIRITNSGKGTSTDDKGKYELLIPANQNVTLEFSYVGYEMSPQTLRLKAKKREKLNIELTLKKGVEIVVKDERPEEMVTEGVKQLEMLPIASGNLESALPSLFMGVRSNNELSAQYSVRGGNYDENLVYVNDFEIYRPFLIRSGQQEGLTFPNIDLIRDLSFSSGGFQAKYGDKMSSVLDIKYKIPDSVRASVGLSLLGATAHVEGSVKKKSDETGKQRLRYLFGARYKTNSYLLSSLDVEGEYNPQFYDLQGQVTYDLNEDWQLGLIGNYSKSIYELTPESLTSTLGLINFALQFRVAFEGQEIDDFETYMGGASLIYFPKDKGYFLKFLASSYTSNENEQFDLIGRYLLGELETDLGSDNLGEIVGVLGVGTEHNFARNFLTANVTNVAHKGGWEVKKEEGDKFTSHFVQWGLRYQNEIIDDQLKEWERLDSAGYSLTYDTSQVLLNEVIKSNVLLNSNRLSIYGQYAWNVKDSLKDISLTAGIRAAYWDLNGEYIFSPRVQFLYKPLKTRVSQSYKLAAGLYFQPPFYRELRNLVGEVNQDVLSQKSLHVVAGTTWDFPIGGKDFRFIAEAYYKYMWDLVPFDLDNVRIRYYGDNLATGYATGLDLRLNGEFVPGAESWVNLSFLRTRESFTGVQHLLREVGRPQDTLQVADVARPMDQFMALSVFFQDYLPQNKNFKVHVNMTISTGLPFGVPNDNIIYRNTYRFNSYTRVDTGFSALLWDAEKRGHYRTGHPLGAFRKAWISLEVFNLLRIRNTAANTWVKTIFNQQYAIPNFLTSRRVNVRLKVDF